MRSHGRLAVAAVVVCCLVGAAGAVVTGPGVDATAGASDGEMTPGGTVSAAVVAEASTLDGTLRAQSYERRLQRAHTTAQRLAVLASMRADLSARLAALERRQAVISNGSLSPAERAYLRTTVTTEAATFSHIADSGATVAARLGNATLADRFRRLAEEYAALGAAVETDLTVRLYLADWMDPLDGVFEDPALTRDVAAGDVLSVAATPLEAVSDRTVDAVLRSPLVAPDQSDYESLSAARRDNATLADVVAVNESALTAVSDDDVAPLRRTDAISLDERALRALATHEGYDVAESVFENRTGDESSDDTDDAVNGTDGTLHDAEDTLDGTDDTVDDGQLSDGSNTTVGDLFNASDGTDRPTDGTDTDRPTDSDGTLNDAEDTPTDSDGTDDAVNGTDGTLNDAGDTLDGAVNGATPTAVAPSAVGLSVFGAAGTADGSVAILSRAAVRPASLS